LERQQGHSSGPGKRTGEGGRNGERRDRSQICFCSFSSISSWCHPHLPLVFVAPTTTVKTTTTSCTTTSRHVATTTEVLPTTVTTTPDLTTGTPLQTGATSVRTTVGTVYPLTAPSAPPQATTGLLTTETTTEGSDLPAGENWSSFP
jgi:hypothetical protein